MKKVLFALAAFISLHLSAQAPQGINYQGVARNSSGTALINQTIGLSFTIHQSYASGPIVYTETFITTTDNLGLFNIIIGNGTPVLGSFTAINWASGPYFIETSIDITGGTSYQTLGTQQMLSVPYSLFAQHSSDWTPSGSDIFSANSDKVGIGIAPYSQRLEVLGAIKVSNATDSSEGSIRYSLAGDLQGATATGWKSLTTVNYKELNSFHAVSSTARNSVVLSTDSLIVPERGTYLIMYTGRGDNNNGYDVGANSYDNEGRTGVVNISDNPNIFIGASYALMFSRYSFTTTVSTYYGYSPLTYYVSAYATLNAGDILKAGAYMFTGGTPPTANWYFTPFKIQLIKVN